MLSGEDCLRSRLHPSLVFFLCESPLTRLRCASTARRFFLGSMNTISIVIPAYNEEKYIGPCLESCVRHKPANVCEIIVIDNASTDRTAHVAAGFAGVRVVHEPRKGLTSARARGLKEAKGDLLAFIDADTRIPHGWFDRINREFQRNAKLVCLSGPYDYFDLGAVKRGCVHMWWSMLAMPMYYATRYMVVGGNFVAKRAALHSIGGFDTSIAFYGEDTNIARRLHSAGKVKFSRRFRIHTSARRFESEGLFKIAAVYAANFFSEAILHKPVTKSYRDIR